ncbi:MAG TPA: LLM class flavin-dependent oxidoreductase [Bacillota bacterium]|nr:LLM class flavin-dependent oxidoreductase [Bacillota bacterium]
MKLSILDQSPIAYGQSAQDALNDSIALAKLGESLGYERYWIAEHHDLFGLACPNPDVMLGVIGSQTNKIKIGAGAVLLPYYKPFRVAETYNLLTTLFPERIDLGIGRAPGGSAEVSMALSNNYLEQVRKYPELLDELLMFLRNNFPEDHFFSKIEPTPIPPTPPNVWMLGTSEKSASLAAKRRMNYAFGHFMTDYNGPQIVNNYRENYKKYNDNEPYVIVAVHVICAATDELAEELAQSYFLWSILQNVQTNKKFIPTMNAAKAYQYTEDDLAMIQEKRETIVIGSPKTVKEKLQAIQHVYNADELMIITIVHDKQAVRQSYRLIAEQFI